ncbi:MAG TPA: RDD family protein [Urbifossiella sp.]|jgi:uncharacterized RDD family membrane protein YckC
MRCSDEMRIETPEQIGVDLELAGLGTRFLAQIVDWFWKLLVSLLLFFVFVIGLGVVGKTTDLEKLSPLVIAVLVGFFYSLWLGYAILFELRWNGQTPGKRFVSIRAVQQNGAPLRAQAACIRNFLAIADFLPAYFVLGAILILLTKNRQRLGDLAAGTIVIRERAAGAGPETADELLEYASEEISFTTSQLKAITPADRIIIRSFLQRFRQMDRSGRERLAYRLVDKLVEKMDFPLAEEIVDALEARTFLASLLRDYEEFIRNM